MGSVLIEKISILNKGLFKKVCRIIVNNSTYFINKFFFYYTQLQKGHFASGQFMVVLTVLLALKHISSVHNISNNAIRICKLHIDTDRLFCCLAKYSQLVNITISTTIVIVLFLGKFYSASSFPFDCGIKVILHSRSQNILL